MEDNKETPTALTIEQKLEIRNIQTKLSQIEISKLKMQTQFEKAVADQKDLSEQLQKYFNENFSQNKGWALDENLEWIEESKLVQAPVN